jgi:hypothetical protein
MISLERVDHNAFSLPSLAASHNMADDIKLNGMTEVKGI